MHFLNRFHDVGPDFPRRIELVPGLELIEKRIRHTLPYAHRSVTLDIAVASNRTYTCPGAPDIPSKEEEIDDLTNRGDCIFMLGKSHCPTTDNALGIHGDFGCRSNRSAIHAA